jgi:hypothetical protein
MQPYWIPYPGYFRLMNAADKLVILDDAQFPRRGFVHRNKLKTHNNTLKWITLPLKKKPLTCRIVDLEFHSDWRELLQQQTRKFPILKNGYGPIEKEMNSWEGSVANLLSCTLKKLMNTMKLTCETYFSSQIPLPAKKGEDRIIELVKFLDGNTYVNLNGGSELYDVKKFNLNGIKIKFLKKWNGSYASILEELKTVDTKLRIGNEIRTQTKFIT